MTACYILKPLDIGGGIELNIPDIACYKITEHAQSFMP